MPKKIIYDEPEEDEDDLEEEDIEEELEEEEKRGKPKLPFQKQKPKEIVKEIKKKPTEIELKRFSVFSSPQRVGIMDAETNEVIAEGDFAVLQVMANILERLERIENSIGAVMEN